MTREITAQLSHAGQLGIKVVHSKEEVRTRSRIAAVDPAGHAAAFDHSALTRRRVREAPAEQRAVKRTGSVWVANSDSEEARITGHARILVPS